MRPAQAQNLFAPAYLLKAATLRPSFFPPAASKTNSSGTLFPDNLSDVEAFFGV